MKPLKFDANKKIAGIMTVFGAVGTLILMLIDKPQSAYAFLKCAFPLMIAAAPAALLYLQHSLSAQVTVTGEGVRIENRRKGLNVWLAWSQFAYLYKIELSTVTKAYPFFLLTDKPMDKQTQQEMYKKCAANRETPWVYEGCLLLNANHYGSEIIQRLPEHIQVMPWSECAHF